MNQNYKHLRIGLAGIGLQAYWEQFDGLESRLRGYLSEVERRIATQSRITVNLGLVDTPAKAVDAGHQCRQNDIEILLIYVTTYALSSTVLPIIQRAKVPVILLNLQPAPSIDYGLVNQMTSRKSMTAEWLAFCGSCPVPEIVNVLKRLDMPFQQVTGMLHDDPECWRQLDDWLLAAEVMHVLAHSRMGLLGHYYSGMLDIATDLAQVSGRFGIHLEVLEVDELSMLRSRVEDPSIEEKLEAFKSFFDIDTDCSSLELANAARTAVALDTFVEKNALDSLAYYYEGTGVPENEATMSSIILGTSMLTGRGVPVAGEYEIKNAIAMKMMDLFKAGGSFTEYYAMDYADDVVLMGHDGPGHTGIAEGKIKVRPLEVYHGKVGRGLSVEMSVKCGPVTLLSVVEDKETGFRLQVAEGESVLGEILQIGNTNSRYKFPLRARDFTEQWNAEGPAHHCAVGVGHIAGRLEKLAKLLKVGFVQVC